MKRHLLDADDGFIFLLGEVHFVDTKLRMVIPPLPTILTNPIQLCQHWGIWPRILILVFELNSIMARIPNDLESDP